MSSEDVQTRPSASSVRSSVRSSRSQNPQQQLSTIEKSVTHLLVATKQLLETLTMWSRGTATEGEVSDVYVRLGYEFNIACRAFNAIGVDTSDLGPVPDLLRSILEDTLSQEASQASLDKYLPRIRDIIINLLHGLKKKQQRLRQRTGGARDVGDTAQPRTGSVASAASPESTITAQLAETTPSRASSGRPAAHRQSSHDLGGPDLPPRTTSAPTSHSPPRRSELGAESSVRQSTSRDTMQSDISSLSSNALQNFPVIPPYPEENTIPTNEQLEINIEPPKSPPKRNDALTALQRGGELERRASRRFSTYQIQRHLGSSMNALGALPPAQNSPIPNRGRDARESLNAVRSRGSVLHGRTKSRPERFESSPNRQNRISEESNQPVELPVLDPPMKPFAQEEEGSPIIKTPEDKLASYPFPEEDAKPDDIAATLNGPLEEPFPLPGLHSPLPERRKATIVRSDSRQARHTPPPSQFVPEGSPQAGTELTLFLQYKSKIKKFVLPDGGDLSVPRLQLAFIEKFAWNTHNNGVALPEIYIQDPVSGVRHELEDLRDIKERSVLVLNVEALDEVKKHIDDGIGGLRRIVEGIKTCVDDQQSALQRVSDQQQETAKELAGIAAAPVRPSVSTTDIGRKVSIKDKMGQLTEVQSLRRDLAVIRQTYSSFAKDVEAQMSTIRNKAASVKKVAADATVPEMDENTGRGYVNKGKKSLSEESESIVNRVDDLQDLVEDLRKDVVSRGVRPLARQLEEVSKDISAATADLKKMQDYLRKEKPIWTKIWEKELQVVCDDRDLLTMQEELAADLEDDLEKAAATFALVEEATKQQNLQNPTGQRSTSRSLPLAVDPSADPQKAKDGVLGEVRALQPNHENRLEAIERAERQRQRELETRKENPFKRELGDFVEEGKLKKSGGVEEVERIRKAREEKARKDFAELQARRRQEQWEKQQAEAAAAEQPETNGETAHEVAKDAETPSRDEERESSPEPVFEEAKEIATPGETPAAP